MYTLDVEAADMDGHGLSSTCKVTIIITDSNDHAPKFSKRMVSSLFVFSSSLIWH